MYVSLLHSEISTHALQFGKLIIKGLVSSPLLATALGIPQGAFQVFFILSGTYLSSRFKNIRTIIMIIYLFPTLIGVCLLWQLAPNESLRSPLRLLHRKSTTPFLGAY